MKKYKGQLKLAICISLIVPLFLFMLKKDAVVEVFAANNMDETAYMAQNEEETEFEVSKISEEDIFHLTSSFMEVVVQDINENTYQVINYDTKAELLTVFKSLTTEEIATLFIDVYYEETEEGLYIIPTATPAWFEVENDYKVMQLDHKIVRVTQFNESDFYGDYQIELEFTFDGSWIISDISYS